MGLMEIAMGIQFHDSAGNFVGYKSNKSPEEEEEDWKKLKKMVKKVAKRAIIGAGLSLLLPHLIGPVAAYLAIDPHTADQIGDVVQSALKALLAGDSVKEVVAETGIEKGIIKSWDKIIDKYNY